MTEEVKPVASWVCAPDVPEDRLPADRLGLTRYYVATNGTTEDGKYLLVPLTSYTMTLERAESLLAQLLPDFPGAGVQRTMTALDLDDPDQMEEFVAAAEQEIEERRRLN